MQYVPLLTLTQHSILEVASVLVQVGIRVVPGITGKEKILRKEKIPINLRK